MGETFEGVANVLRLRSGRTAAELAADGSVEANEPEMAVCARAAVCACVFGGFPFSQDSWRCRLRASANRARRVREVSTSVALAVPLGKRNKSTLGAT